MNNGLDSDRGNRAAASTPEAGGMTPRPSSPFPPPPPDANLGSAATPSPSRPKTRRARFAIPIVLVLVLVVAGGWALFRRSGDTATGSTRSDELRLPTDPQQRYVVTFESDVTSFGDAVGTPTRMAGRVVIDNEDTELRVYDADGTELWRRDVDYRDDFFMIGGDVVLGLATQGDEEQRQLLRLDGDDGHELWSTDGLEFGSMLGTGGDVLLFDRNSSSPKVVAIDGQTGDKIVERQLPSDESDIPQLTTSDGIVTVEDNELLIVDDDLEPISETISWNDLAQPSVWAYMDSEIVTIDDNSISLVSADGTKVVNADIDVDIGDDVNLARINSIWGVSDSVWVYQTTNGCGAFEFSGVSPKSLWHLAGCFVSERSVIRYETGDPLVFPEDPDGDVIDALTGERVHEGTDSVVNAFPNGFIEIDATDITAYSWPGANELFSISRTGDSFAQVPIDLGYIALGSEGDNLTITVFG